MIEMSLSKNCYLTPRADALPKHSTGVSETPHQKGANGTYLGWNPNQITVRVDASPSGGCQVTTNNAKTPT